MDIYKLRQAINVTTYSSHSNGCTIYYTFLGEHKSVTVLPKKLIAELFLICSIDKKIDEIALTEYNISQWDALNIVIRYEQAKAMDKEIDNSDIGKAIKKITDGQGDAY